MIVPVVVGLFGAALLGAGFVVQQREASRVDVGDGLSVRLVIELARRRLWWLGVAAMAAGYLLAGWSLGSGNLVLAEPLIASNLLFALIVAATWRRQRPTRRSVVGAVALAGGVAGFVVAGNPHGGRSVHVAATAWAWSAVVVAGVVVALIAVALRRTGSGRAVLLGAATGVTYGMQDALTRRVYGGIGAGMAPLLESWPVWTLIVVGALGVLLAQNAFDCAPLSSSLPAISVGEPVTGIVLGVVLFGSRVRADALGVGFEVLSLVVMLAGAVLVSRARVVHEAASAAPSARRRELRRAA